MINTTPIRKVGIIGAGTMGSGIAAQLVNSGIPVVLLDRPTPNAADSPTARTELTENLFQRMVTGRPIQLGRLDLAKRVTLGNTTDHFHLLADCDWVIEVIIEQLQPKQALMARLEATCHPEAIISSNTSGIPISQIAANCSADFKRRFLGTHFFNPPRYLKLLEIIPTADTDPQITQAMSDFGRDTLGKGVVRCKDTPNFIANRFGAVTGAYLAETALASGFHVTDIDTLVGPLIGRPKTGYFRLADLVGLDIRTSVLRNLYPAVPHDPYRDLLKGEKSWSIYNDMLDKGWLGNKSKQGFYKKEIVAGKRNFYALNLDSLTYEQQTTGDYPALATARIRSLPERLKTILATKDDPAADLIRSVLYNTFEYAAYAAPEIAYTLIDIDNAVRWGFNHQMGPFELWQALGTAETAADMETHGHTVPTWVKTMLAHNQTFYTDTHHYDFTTQQPAPSPQDPKHLSIKNDIAPQHTPLAQNDSATLYDMGGDVLLLEFHTKVNALDVDIFALGDTALDIMAAENKGLVIGNEGRHFSVGANLGKSAATDWEATSARIRRGQEFMMRLRHSPQPVVTALHGRALGGGCEIAMQGWHSVADHELKIGLVEFNVGLIPAWTGCKELLRRRINPLAKNGADPEAIYNECRTILALLMAAQVSNSAWDAKTLGYLRESDTIVMNPDHRLSVAKQLTQQLMKDPPAAPPLEQIYAAGSTTEQRLQEDLALLESESKISAYDALIGRKLARIICGGTLQPEWVDPWQILNLEREASLAIRGNDQTKARIAHMLKTGKPLRN